MQIITPDYILTPDTLLSNMSVAFDKKIKKIAPLKELKKEFPDAVVTKLKKNSLLMPGLINAHVHLEFSANRTKLSYGDFISWLYSVIENREELIGGCDSSCMTKAIDSMLESGITTFGAISSHGMDLQACADAKQNVIFFNELIGSQAKMADALFTDFLARLDASKSIKREGFYSGVAIHSPYSVHPILIKKALQIVKKEKLKLTTHFMESSAERDWLDKSEGDFKDFFQNLLKQNSSLSSSSEFLEHFSGYMTLLTHAIKANEEELKMLSSNGHTVIHCPISNRLLGNGALDLKKLQEHNIRWICATDGLSSNYKLDLFEEMKCALFMHSNMPLLELAKQLIRSVTKDAADALGINSGEIAEGKSADMIVLDLQSKPSDELAIHLILHRYNISKVYINGILEKGI
ncbi:MAG: metal-dependent hydrolase [Sulfurimonas sp.]|uniref:aminofutalosine deaminase family hydrolase n=1 Tax=Sulfurimonas sp. TaxID=2022749 RepID=UPI0025CFE574|nr:metal-dependent hydrolase [Sulfurimonas sp.]MCK9454461.1 metal-dependent hydrolase [Sulfurimonas sp.]